MKATVISSSSMVSNRFRLDSSSYISGPVAFNIHLDKLSIGKHALRDLTLNDPKELWEIGRIYRLWVNEPDDGVPFLSSTDILRADLSNVKLISKTAIQLHPELLLHEGWILVPRSGSIGSRVVYCRSDMSDMAASEDILRIIPNPAKILPGYLYAFLSSRPGTSLIASGAYNSVIPHISAQYIARLPIPRLGELERTCHDLCIEAAKFRVEAGLILKKAGNLVNEYFGFPKRPVFSRKQGSGYFSAASVSSMHLRSRMDATFHNAFALEGDRLIGSITTAERLSNLVEMNTTELLRSAFVFEKYGIPLISKSDMLHFYYAPTRFLLRDHLPPDERWAIGEGDLLLTPDKFKPESTCIGLYADERFHGSCPAPGIFHFKGFDKKIPSGYLYAYFFLTDLGSQQLTRTIVRSSTPHFSLKDILAIPIPRAASDRENGVDMLVKEAGRLRAEAQRKEDRSRELIELALQYEE